MRRGNAALRKNHASEKIIYVLSSEPIVPEARRYEPPQAMPIACKRNDPFKRIEILPIGKTELCKIDEVSGAGFHGGRLRAFSFQPIPRRVEFGMYTLSFSR